ncbi:Alpha/Beta hydrolase protein [Aspergillus pseudotamarii]|uniref:Alpha/Beta hydrolase protein n=1 Tax=Aspergillus pseudotamarii TaxID=132259 RepID=A0A5N6SPC0_ASPPS|nr:Alpha/Beta hydrolase protein [Aspergillus pseudotamarii]KAE8135193.1 Alpha/Beta hydrolase protein [Aspergillus pseudotamarii]
MDPKQADLVIYHLRGSGYALGHPGDTLPGLLFLAEVLEKKGIRVCMFTLDYTLVSNGVYPRQVCECFGAYEYLIEEVGVRAEKICLMGESAGGHLGLSFLVGLALSKRGSFSFPLDHDEEKEKKDKDEGEEYPRPGSMILLSPWIDLFLSSPLIPMLEKRDFMSRTFLQRVGKELLHSDTRLISLFGDFTSRSTERGSWERILPTRMWVSAGADEVFMDDIVRFVNCAREDGVEVELRVESGKCHSWQSGEAFLAARRFLDMSMQCEGEELMPGLVEVGEVIAGFV